MGAPGTTRTSTGPGPSHSPGPAVTAPVTPWMRAREGCRRPSRRYGCRRADQGFPRRGYRAPPAWPPPCDACGPGPGDFAKPGSRRGRLQLFAAVRCVRPRTGRLRETRVSPGPSRALRRRSMRAVRDRPTSRNPGLAEAVPGSSPPFDACGPGPADFAKPGSRRGRSRHPAVPALPPPRACPEGRPRSRRCGQETARGVFWRRWRRASGRSPGRGPGDAALAAGAAADAEAGKDEISWEL